MSDFENKSIFGIYATRFIASWTKMGGMLYTKEDLDDFRAWLSSLGLEMDGINAIVFLAITGKLELEVNAKAFLEKLNSEQK